MWFETELGLLAYWSGDWDAADTAFGRLETWVADVGPHYMEAAAKTGRAKVRCARGDRRGAQADIESALDFARRSGEPQSLRPTLADAALIAATTGDRGCAQHVAHLFDELLGAMADDVAASFWSTAFVLALALTDQADRFASLDVGGPSRWLAAARLIAAGRYERAAEDLAAIGAMPEEALARLLAARQLIGAGDRARGEAELGRAVEFWRRVRATRYAETAEAMLAKTA
jgi:hypothetical protein